MTLLARGGEQTHWMISIGPSEGAVTEHGHQGVYRLVPHPHLGAEDFRRLAARDGWAFEGEVEEDEDLARPHQLVFVKKNTATAATRINVIDDMYAGIRYLEIRGHDAAALHAKLAGDGEWFYDRESILAAIAHAKNSAESIRAILHVGVSAPPEYDEEYFMVFDAFFGHPDAAVRRENVTAIAYADWLELRPLLEEVVREDPDETVCAAAEALLAYQPDEAPP